MPLRLMERTLHQAECEFHAAGNGLQSADCSTSHGRPATSSLNGAITPGALTSSATGYRMSWPFGEAILDGEVVALDSGGRQNFRALIAGSGNLHYALRRTLGKGKHLQRLSGNCPTVSPIDAQERVRLDMNLRPERGMLIGTSWPWLAMVVTRSSMKRTQNPRGATPCKFDSRLGHATILCESGSGGSTRGFPSRGSCWHAAANPGSDPPGQDEGAVEGAAEFSNQRRSVQTTAQKTGGYHEQLTEGAYRSGGAGIRTGGGNQLRGSDPEHPA
jgi:hypothetical protein